MYIHKFINLNDIPKYRGGIYWDKSIGMSIYFEYEDIKGNVEILDYVKREQKIKFKYKNRVYDMNTTVFKSVCFGKILGKITDEFKIEIGSNFKDDKRNLRILDREYRKDKNGGNWKSYKYKCNKCGWNEGWMDEYDLLKGQGCSCCNGKIVVPGINDIATTDPWMIEYLVDKEDAYKYTSKSGKKIKVKCSDCGSEKYIKINALYECGFSCPKCGDGFSYPEKFMFNILEQLNMDFMTEYSPIWSNNYRFDFYLPKYNIIIETHGKQHYESSTNFNVPLETQQIIDRDKENLSMNNGVKIYIQLDCRESNLNFIKNSVLNSELIKYFNFNIVDWNKCNEYATKNKIKEICEFYNSHKYMQMKDIAKKFKIHHLTLIKYLKIGKNLNLCDYDANHQKKPIIVIETGDIFESIMECERQSENKYGVKLSNKGISNVLKGRCNHYKGFHFEYVN